MPKIFKADYVTIDSDHKVSIDILDPAVYERYFEPEEASSGSSYSNSFDNEETEIDLDTEAENVLDQAKKEADLILAEANAKTEEILAKAKSEAEILSGQIQKQASEEGYKKGYDKGISETEEIKNETQQIYDDMVFRRKNILESTEPEIIALIIGIVRTLTGSAVKVTESAVLALIKKGLSDATLTGDIFIHVSPEDYEKVVGQKQEILSMIDASAKVEFMKDLTLGIADCIIETPFGNIDCSLEQQFEALKMDLLSILDSGDR